MTLTLADKTLRPSLWRRLFPRPSCEQCGYAPRVTWGRVCAVRHEEGSTHSVFVR